MFWKSLPEYTKNFQKDLENTLRDHYALYLVMKIVSRSEIEILFGVPTFMWWKLESSIQFFLSDLLSTGIDFKSKKRN